VIWWPRIAAKLLEHLNEERSLRILGTMTECFFFKDGTKEGQAPYQKPSPMYRICLAKAIANGQAGKWDE
jgi:hypothetical protein